MTREVYHTERVSGARRFAKIFTDTRLSVYRDSPKPHFFRFGVLVHHQRCFCLSKECEVAMEHYRKEEKRVGDYYFIL